MAVDEAHDRISSLPDPILHHILHYLPVRASILTTCLSKRWNRVWITMPTLVLCQKNREDSSSFSSFVDHTLMACNSKYIQTFILRLSDDIRYKSKLPVWLSSVADGSMKALGVKYHQPIELPPSICVNSNIESLCLDCALILNSENVRWPSLKSLYLKSMVLDDNTVKNLVAGCPNLNVLVIEGCGCQFERLDVSSMVNLKSLAIRSVQEHGYGEKFQVCCSNLSTLVISGFLWLRKYHLVDLSSVTEATLVAEVPPIYAETPLVDIIKGLSNVEVLTFGGWSLEELSTWNHIMPFSLLNLRTLILTAHFSVLDVMGLACMLQCSPKLETLIIDLKIPPSGALVICGEKGMENHWTSQDASAFKCLSHHLRMVKITGLGMYNCEDEHLLQFLAFLMKNALVLEKIVIVPHDRDNQLVKTAVALMMSAQSSSSAKVIVV